MENTEVKMETEERGLWGFVRKHRNKIIGAGIVVGVTLLAIGSRAKEEPTIEVGWKDVVEAMPEEARATESKGYDIWAMCNGQDPQVVEFAPKLEQFGKENGLDIMCEMYD